MTVMTEILDHESALAYLFGRINYEWMARVPYGDRALKLKRMRDLLDGLGQPQRQLPIVHVAGTKGKGSTCTMIAAMLTAAGYRTGLYTSPHLERVEERMCVDGRACSDDEFVSILREIQPVVDALDHRVELGCEYDMGPTYFEITTAAALMHFARQAADVVVLEVGLGGRLDSTNVCEPTICAITSISYDHTRQLGDTLAEIAGEKAGIIKPRVPVISGVIQPEPAAVIEKVARRHGCDLYRLGRDFEASYQRFRLIEPDDGVVRRPASLVGELDYRELIGGEAKCWRNVQVGMPGRHQAANAAVALAVTGRLAKLGWRLDEASMRNGLARVQTPARTEIISQHPTVLLDVAHNVASVAALLGVLQEAFAQAPKRILVFATSRDKDARGMLELLTPWFDTIILTRYLHNPRFVEPQELEALAREAAVDTSSQTRILTAADPGTAWQIARNSASENDFICITGSFFLAAELRGLVS